MFGPLSTNRRWVAGLSALVRTGDLRIGLPDGEEILVGDGTGPSCSIEFIDFAALRRAVWDPELGFAEMYVEGRMLLKTGTLVELFSLLARNKRFAKRQVGPIYNAVRRFFGAQVSLAGSMRRATKDVRYHYDGDYVLFSSFLDDDLNYSCAYFASEQTSLEDAQQAKQGRILAKLNIKGGRLLDIGCGWGSFSIRAAKEFPKLEVLGVSLSPAQIKVARQRAQDAGVADRVRFECQDYRQIDDHFDHIVSIGMLEHVGKKRLHEYFCATDRLLKKDGTALAHFIARTKPSPYSQPFGDKYIFPGGYAPAVSEVIRQIEQTAFLTRDIEVLPKHYAWTLAEWSKRFQSACASGTLQLPPKERRVWEAYFAGAEVGFTVQRLFVAQVLMSKHNDRLPMTRSYY